MLVQLQRMPDSEIWRSTIVHTLSALSAAAHSCRLQTASPAAMTCNI